MRFIAGIIGAVALLVATSASAQIAVQVGVQGGGTIASTEVSVPGVAVDGVGARSSRPDFGARVGADWHVVGSPLTIGAFGEWDNQSVQFKAHAGPTAFTADLGDSYSLGGRVGVFVGKSLIYGGAAWTHTQASASIAGLPGSYNGITYLGGVEFPLTKHISLVLPEVRFTEYQSEAIHGVDFKPTSEQVMFRVNYNFYADAAAPAAARGYVPLK